MMSVWKRCRTTEKVFAKCGQNLTESSILTKRSNLLFRGTKLLKNVERKASYGKILQIVQLAFHPAFCKYNVVRSFYFIPNCCTIQCFE